jgi:hypothetical protein
VKKYVIYGMLFISNLSNAYMSGDGSVELGLSVEERKTTLGLAGDYGLSLMGSQVSTRIDSEFKLGANLGTGRIDESFTESNYQYEQSLIGLNGQVDYQFDQRNFNWYNAFDTEIVFQQENENKDVHLDINDAEKSWSVTSGPRFILGKKSSLSMTAEVLISHKSALEVDSAEENYSLTISKPLSPLTLFEIDGRNVCTQNLDNVSLEQDACRKEYNIRLSKINKHSKILLERGVSVVDSKNVNLYLATFSYHMNSYSQLAISNKRSINTIAEQENIILEPISRVSDRVINTRSIKYSLDKGRAKIDLVFIDQVIDDELSLAQSSIASARMAYPMDTRVCSLCNLNVVYEYTNLNEERIQKVTTFSLLKYNTRQLSTAIKFSRSVVEKEFDVWSMNLSISYNADFKKIGGR